MQAKLPKLEAADEPAGDGEWWVTSVNKGPIDTVIVIRSGDTVTAKRVADAIAAAPDLLEACIQVCSDLEMAEWDSDRDGVTVLQKLIDEHYPKLKAAIRKAEGGAE